MNPNDLPVGTPVYGATVRQAWSRFWKGYVSFQGRSSPSEFWWSYLITTAVTYVLAILYVVIAFVAMILPIFTTLGAVANDDPNAIIGGAFASFGLVFAGAAPMMLWSLAILLPTYALMARRLRDAGFSPWLVLVSLVVPIVPIALCGLETKVHGVALGAAPPAAYGQPGAQQPAAYGQPGAQQPAPYWPAPHAQAPAAPAAAPQASTPYGA